MRSQKSFRLQDSADSDESDKSDENSTASEDTEVSSDDEVNKKLKKRKKHSSTSESDSDDTHRRKNKKKKHKKKKRKHSKKKRHRSQSSEDESDTNEDISSEEGEMDPPKKKRKHKHKQKHSKKKRSKSTSLKAYTGNRYNSAEDSYSKQPVSLSEEEISLSSEDNTRQEHVHATHRVEQQNYKYHHHVDRSRHHNESNDFNRFYRGSSKEGHRRGEIISNSRYTKELVVNEHQNRYTRMPLEQRSSTRFEHYGGQGQSMGSQENNLRYKDNKANYASDNYNNKYDKRNDRNQNHDHGFYRHNRYTDANQNNRYEERRYPKEKEDYFYKRETSNRDFDKPVYRNNRLGDNRREYGYNQKRNEVKDSLPDKYNNDSKPGTSGRNNRHYRNEQPVREHLQLPADREESHTRSHNEKNYGRYERDNRRDRSYDKSDGHDEKEDRYDRNDRPHGKSDKQSYKDNKSYSKNDRTNDKSNDKYDNKDRDKKPDRDKDQRQPERKSRRENKEDDKKTYDWGKKSDGVDIKKEKVDKDKPNFGLSGKLTEDTNMVNGVVLKYSPPDDAKQPKRRWRFYPFKGDKSLPTLYIHRQNYFLLGRDRRVADIPLDHPSVSKQHAVLQYRMVSFTRDNGTTGRKVRPYIIDLESANGTFVNNKKIEARKFIELLERDVVKFGFSQREYVLLHENSKDEAMDDDDVKLGDVDEIEIKKETKK